MVGAVVGFLEVERVKRRRKTGKVGRIDKDYLQRYMDCDYRR